MNSLIIAGDLVPFGKFEDNFIKGNVDFLINDLKTYICKDTYNIVNLESPLTESRASIIKEGPLIKSKSKCINGIVKLGINAVNLANNHILDYGQQGLSDTLSILESSEIDYFGAGYNLKKSWNILCPIINGKKIAILGMAEHEFSIATENSAGACPFDIIDYIKFINANKKKWEYLIVLIHGGNEYYPYPNPYLQKKCRFLTEYGADCVICQHSHISGSYEYYHDKLIVYGQGNFIFHKQKPPNSEWNKGFLIKINIDTKINYEFLPYILDNERLRLMKVKEKEEFLNTLKARNKIVVNEENLQQEWHDFCKANKHVLYRRLFMPFFRNKLVKKIFKRFKVFHKIKLHKKRSAILLNLFRCESHRYALETIFENQVKN